MRGMIVVEHMEEEPTRWLVAEYIEARDAALDAGLGFLVAGVRDPRLQSILSREGVDWSWEHSWELCDKPGTIVLDMWAERDLQPWEAEAADCIVVGGIMGDHPPRGRGRLLSWMFDWSSVRRLGPWQMSIHTAVWAAIMVARGVRVEDLPLAVGAEIEVEAGFGTVRVELPFAYPKGPDGRPVVPERIRKILARGVVYDEEVLLG